MEGTGWRRLGNSRKDFLYTMSDSNKQYNFYGNENAAKVVAVNKEYGVTTAIDLYDKLLHCWSIETCAPRLRSGWSEDNPTHGQCSITAFLAQDIFGGDVYGVKTGSGIHCYNVVDGIIFDLASEQFGDKVKELDYTPVLLQDRNAPNHFGNGEKEGRYIILKENLLRG